jgi:hypothetical protein
MRTANDIRFFGMMKLAQEPEITHQQAVGHLLASPARALDVATTGTFSAPTPQEAASMNSYARSSIAGGLTGGALATILAAVTKRSVLPYMLTGIGTGTLAALARQYDQASDPPGLSPVYTVPAGLRLGALTGAVAGAPLGKLFRAGMLPGAIVGALSGAAAGGAVSSFI